MAFSAILRRSAARAAPLAARLIGSQRQAHSSVAAAAAASAAFNRAALRPSVAAVVNSSRRFASSAVSSSASDSKLLEVVKSEIAVVEDSEDFGKNVEVPGDFPFSIEDNVGEQTVTLKREYDGETIQVEVSMPNLITGEDEEEEEVDDEDEERGTTSSVPLLVTVQKKNGAYLEFDCTALPDEIRINSLSLKTPEAEDQLAYEGPDFLDLDENLQKAFHKYLEIRGIKPSATNFLHEYMIEKDNKEYVQWLKDVKQFVEA